MENNEINKKCKKCGASISNNLKKCPNCGFEEKKISVMMIILIVIIAVLVIIILTLFTVKGFNALKSDNQNENQTTNQNNSQNNSQNNNQNNNNSKDETNSTQDKNSQSSSATELSEYEKMLFSISALIDEGLAFDAGNYVKGDIPTGEYAFVKLSGSSSYYSEEDAAGNIVDNENFSSFGYVKVHAVGNITTRGVLISVSAFDKLGVSGAKEIFEKLNNQQDYNQGGYYKIGVDLPAGTYTVESLGRGYYAILSGPVSDSDIVDNDNFNGKATISVRNGQYLELSRAQIIQ